ncbi:MAG: rhodanese-like domain-containing protein [Saprospiraceae bacterium]|nr:rhodanese-like domain-containing protein [Saprospiraceae bacterium]
MNKLISTVLFTLLVMSVSAQAICTDPAFDNQVRRYLKQTVPVMDVDTLANIMQSVMILDARDLEEYQVSHIPGARHIGYKQLDLAVLNGLPKETPIVVYCSIGYRSERVGERLREMGYPHVHNLYGSMFEWVNRGRPVTDATGTPTNRVHGYSKAWSRWILNPAITKVW